MKHITKFIETKIAPFAGKLSRQPHLQALMNVFLVLIPFITIGSFSLLIVSPIMDYTTMDPGVMCSIMKGWANLASVTGPIFGFIYLVTMTLMSLYVSIGLGYFLSKHYKMNSFFAVIVTVAAFLIVATMNSEGTISIKYLDASGMFTSIIISVLAFEAYRYLSEHKIGYISITGSGIPPAIVESVGNLVPATVVLLGAALVSGVTMLATGVLIPELISVVVTPMVGIIDTPAGLVILMLLVQVFWWFGIHDSVITGPLTPFLVANLTANVAAYGDGTAANMLPHIVTNTFWGMFGLGCLNLTLALLCITSKSKQIKTIGKLGFIPAIFNISEPMLFGLPIVYNATLLVPFLVITPLNSILSYLAMSAHLINRTFVDPSWNMPVLFGQFLSTMDFRTIIYFMAMFVLDLVIWLPFFKSYEKQKLEEEKVAEE